MTLQALTTSQLWTLLGGLGSAIVVLYVLKLRRRRIRVPFSPLWSRAVPERKASSLFQALKRLVSLLVQLAILALIVLAIADPKLADGCQGSEAQAAKQEPEPTTTVLVVDASASMRATDVPGGRLSAALDAGRKVLSELDPARDQAMVVRLDTQARPLTPFTSDPDALQAALAGISAVDTGTDLRAALPFLRDVIAERPNPRVVLVTDGGLEAPTEQELVGLPLQVVQVGGDGGDNIALLTFHVRPYLDDSLTYEIFYRVRSFVDRPVEATLLLYADPTARSSDEMFRDENVVGSYPVTLQPDGITEDFIKDVEFPGSRFGARVVPAEGSGVTDVLPRDDAAFGLVPERKRLRVQLVTDDNLFLEAALFLRENLSFTKVAPSEYEGPTGFDVTILDRFLPPVLGPGNYLLVDPRGESSPFAGEGTVPAPDLRVAKKGHPLMWKISLVDLNVAEVAKLETKEGDQVVATTSGGDPVIVARATPEQRLVAWGFDVRKSDLPLRYAFPVMVVNTLHWFFAEDDALLTGRTTGRDQAVGVKWPVRQVTVTPPRGEPYRTAVIDGKALLTGDEAGVYELTAEGEDDVAAVAANLNDERESSLVATKLALPEWKPAPPPEPAEAAPAPTTMEQALALVEKDLWKALLLAALLISTLEWFTYHRRITV
jgi:hypothetical protein